MGRGGEDAETSGCAEPDTGCLLLPANGDWQHASGVRGHKPARGNIQWQACGQVVLLARQPWSIPVLSPTAAPVVVSLLASQTPSLAPLHPRWCRRHAGPQEVRFYRRPVMPWQYKIPPSADLTPHPEGQVSSPTHGWPFRKRASDICPVQNTRRTSQEE